MYIILVEAPSRFVSVLDKRRWEIKQQDENLTEGEDFDQDQDDESVATQKEQDKGLSIFRYSTLYIPRVVQTYSFLMTVVLLKALLEKLTSS